MRTSSLVVGLTAVFAGLTALLVVLAFAFELGLLVLAIPFGAATYVFWYHASGRLAQRVRRRHSGVRSRSAWGRTTRSRTTRSRASQGRTARSDGGGTASETGGFGAGPREAWNHTQNAGRGFEGNAGRRRTRANRRVNEDRSKPSVAKAYEVLGVESGADAATIKRAYRRRVKEVHPDTDGGDERAFKRVNEAYERLAE